MFLSTEVFSEATTQSYLRNNLIYTFRKFQGNIERKVLYNKRVVSSVYSKRLKFYGKKLQLRSYSSEACSRRRLQNRYSYKDFTKFTEKAPVPDSVFNEVAGL